MPFVLYELQDHVAVITLNRPERMNALGSKLSAELRAPGVTSRRWPAVGDRRQQRLPSSARRRISASL